MKTVIAITLLTCLGGCLVTVDRPYDDTYGYDYDDTVIIIDDDPIREFFGYNNESTLSGDTLGDGFAYNFELSKTVPVDVWFEDPNIIAAPTSTVSIATLNGVDCRGAVQVTNVSSRSYCFIEGLGITYEDAWGYEVGYDGDQFINGSVGVVTSGASDTCLAPGESGYLYTLLVCDLDDVDWLVLDGFDYSVATVEEPYPQFIAVEYGAGWNEFAVWVRNIGLQSGVLGTAPSTYALLDASGDVLWWSFLDAPSAYEMVQPDREAVLTEGSLIYDGVSSRLRVHVAYGTLNASALSASSALTALSSGESDDPRVVRNFTARSLRNAAELK